MDRRALTSGISTRWLLMLWHPCCARPSYVQQPSLHHKLQIQGWSLAASLPSPRPPLLRPTLRLRCHGYPHSWVAGSYWEIFSARCGQCCEQLRESCRPVDAGIPWELYLVGGDVLRETIFIRMTSRCAGRGTPYLQIAVSQNCAPSGTEHSQVHDVPVERYLEEAPADVYHSRGLLREA